MPTTAINKMVRKLSKNSRFGTKYPASKIMGGSMYKKKVVGVSGETWTPFTWKSIRPMRIPVRIRRHDSGKMCDNFGVTWKPCPKTFLIIYLNYGFILEQLKLPILAKLAQKIHSAMIKGTLTRRKSAVKTWILILWSLSSPWCSSSSSVTAK